MDLFGYRGPREKSAAPVALVVQVCCNYKHALGNNVIGSESLPLYPYSLVQVIQNRSQRPFTQKKDYRSPVFSGTHFFRQMVDCYKRRCNVADGISLAAPRQFVPSMDSPLWYT
jgi:hypothetical protein